MEQEKLRLDKYLWAIRIFKTRTLAAKACADNKVLYNGQPAKASKNVSIGDVYEIKAKERKWHIEVTGLLHQRRQYSEAINFYIDHTSEEEKQSTKPMVSSFYTGKRKSKIGRPTKKDRRDLDNLFDN